MTDKQKIRLSHPGLETLGMIVILLSLTSAAAFVLGVFPQNPQSPMMLRASSIGLLGLFVLMNAKELDHFLLAAAIFIATIADGILASGIEDATIRGLRVFILSNAILIFLFWRNRISLAEATHFRTQIASLIWAASVFGLFLEFERIAELDPFIIGYIIFVLVMATTATLSRFPLWMASPGAILMIGSHALLGAILFLSKAEVYLLFGWPAFYFGQLLVMLSVMFGPQD